MRHLLPLCQLSRPTNFLGRVKSSKRVFWGPSPSPPAVFCGRAVCVLADKGVRVCAVSYIVLLHAA